MHFLLQKAIKGKAIADFLEENLGSDMTRFHEGLLDEMAKAYSARNTVSPQVWELYFDSAARTSLQENPIAGVGIALIFP